MTKYERLSDLQSLVGTTIGTSEWKTVSQSRIDEFAAATGDFQWVHVDPTRAAAGPFGTTIAHGFLTLSFLPSLMATAYSIEDVVMTVNYGLNRVRFPALVPVDSSIQATFKLLAYSPLPRGAQLVIEMSAHRMGQHKPVCVAESVLQQFVSQN